MKLSCLAAGFLALLLTTGVARAQMSPDLIMETYNSNIRVITDGAINKSVLDKSIARNRNAGSSRAATSKTAAATTRLSYTSTPALRQKTVQNYVTRLRPVSPGVADAVAETFGPGKQDYGPMYRTLISGHGLRDNDAADAMAAFMLVGYMVVNDVRDDKSITPAKAQAVRAQLAPLLARNELASKPGALAQTGEEMKLQAVIVQSGWNSALRKGGDQLLGYRKGVAKLFSTQYGLDMTKFRLTDNGLVAR